VEVAAAAGCLVDLVGATTVVVVIMVLEEVVVLKEMWKTTILVPGRSWV
jgi:hypothetical protein